MGQPPIVQSVLQATLCMLNILAVLLPAPTEHTMIQQRVNAKLAYRIVRYAQASLLHAKPAM